VHERGQAGLVLLGDPEQLAEHLRGQLLAELRMDFYRWFLRGELCHRLGYHRGQLDPERIQVPGREVRREQHAHIGVLLVLLGEFVAGRHPPLDHRVQLQPRRGGGIVMGTPEPAI
jgi:hypothetical protein